jgi:type II secretory pathway component PulM
VNFRAWWAAAQSWYAAHGARDRRIMAGVGAAIALSLVYVLIVEPLRDYRRGVAEEIAEGQEQLESAARFVGALDGLRAERDQLVRRLEEAKHRLLPGDSGTLGAAALQERTNTLATEKGVTVQSTQVMREEVVEPFRKVAVRLTLSSELKPLAELLAGLEYGAHELTIPFIEVSRRGAMAGAKGPRTVSATVEVSGYLLAAAAPAKPETEAVEGEAPAGEAPAAEPAPPEAGAEPPVGPPVPAPEAD